MASEFWFWCVLAALWLAPVLMLVVLALRMRFRRRVHEQRLDQEEQREPEPELGAAVQQQPHEVAPDEPPAEQGGAQGPEPSEDWERRFWEMHGVVERVLQQRDEWRDLYRQQVAEHLEGQALLEHKIVQMRLHLGRLIGTHNRMIKERDGEQAKLVKGPSDLDPPDADPVGQAERYYERMRELLLSTAPAKFDALTARDGIAAKASSESDSHSG